MPPATSGRPAARRLITERLMTERLITERLITERFSAQLLSGPPARSAVAVTGRLLVVQGQDPRGARLAIRSRSAGLTAADVDRALTVDRSLLITWLNRGTLHLVRSEDYWWLQPLLAPQLLTGNARRLAQEGVSPAGAEKAVAVIEDSLAAEGPLTRLQLRDRIAAAGVRTEGQALVHLLMLASLLLWIVLFNHKAESPTFIIAMSGIGIWYFGQERQPLNLALLIGALFLVSLSVSDLVPHSVREHLVKPYRIKALIPLVIWCKLLYELLSGSYRPIIPVPTDPAGTNDAGSGIVTAINPLR